MHQHSSKIHFSTLCRQLAVGVLSILCFYIPAASANTFPRETFVQQWGSLGDDPGEFDFASDIAVSPNGDKIYVLDTRNDRVQVFAPTGEFLFQWGKTGNERGQFEAPNGIAVSATGDVYVADTYNDRIQVFKADGSFIRQWGTMGEADGQFNHPYDVAISRANEVFVTDRDNFRVQAFSTSGEFRRKWGTEGNGERQFNAPTAIAVSSDNEVYVSDEYDHRIQVFTTSGTFRRQWGTQGSNTGLFEAPVGIAIRDKEIFVSDQFNHRIQVFTPNGQFLRQWGKEGRGMGQFALPAGLAVAQNGTIYVSDRDNFRIQAFKTVEATIDGFSLRAATLSGAATNAKFNVGMRYIQGEPVIDDAVAPGEATHIVATIQAAPAHRGQVGSLLAVVYWQQMFFMKTPRGWALWDLNPQTLQSFETPRPLKEQEWFVVQESVNNLGLSGVFSIFTGYRAQNGDIHFNGEPFMFEITR